MQPFSIHPETLLGPVNLTVSDLERANRFYGDIIGLRLLQQSENRAWLGADEATPLVVLTEQPDARPKPPHTTGLYHLAILTPSRLDLARSLRRLMEMDYPLQGASDHLVSEALYLDDPDGNGLEIYADRPRRSWRTHDGQLQMATVPLNMNDLLRESEQDKRSWSGLPAQTRIGHVHLHVADLDQAEAFYCDVLGFDLAARYGPSASFVSAGGYHHHIGMNTWAGAGAPQPPPGAVGLRTFTICLPNSQARSQLLEHLRRSEVPFSEHDDEFLLRDPSHNGILLAVDPEVKRADVAPVVENVR